MSTLDPAEKLGEKVNGMLNKKILMQLALCNIIILRAIY